MDIYLENHIYSEYPGVNLEDLFSFSLLHKRAPAVDTVQNITRKPLRGWGRFMPSIKAADENCIETVRLESKGALKGLGRKQHFYSDLVKLFAQNKPKTDNHSKKEYTYWRGAGRPIPKATTSEYLI